MKRLCEICLTIVNKSGARFCSYQCSNSRTRTIAWQKSMENLKGINNPFYGKKHSLETRLKMSSTPRRKRGRSPHKPPQKIDREVCILCCKEFFFYKKANEGRKFCSQSCAAKSKVGEKHPMWGKKHSIETRLRISRVKTEFPSNWKGGRKANNKRYYKERTLRRIINGGTFTKREFEDLKKKYNHMCLCCKKQEPFVKLSADHIIPLFVGGRDDIENIQPLCLACNKRKHTKTIDYRYAELLQ